MVKFHPDSFTIEVKTNCNPIETWLNMHDEMIDALQSEDEEMHNHRFFYLRLLREMMPDVWTAQKMIKE